MECCSSEKPTLSVLAQTAVPKYQTVWLKQWKFIFSSFWRLEVPDRGQAGSISGEGSLPRLQTAAFLLCPHKAARLSQLSTVSSYKGANSTGLGPHFTISFNHNYFLTPNTVTLGVRASAYEHRGNRIQSIAFSKTTCGKEEMFTIYCSWKPQNSVYRMIQILSKKAKKKNIRVSMGRLEGFMAC